MIPTTWHSGKGLEYMCKTLYKTEAEYTFISGTHGIVSRIDYMLGQKQVLINLRSLKYFSKHNGRKLQVNSKRKAE